jgi:hypothetical protein
MNMRLDLILPGTRLSASGEGHAFEIAASETRVFMCTMFITEQIEQESVDISVWGSADGQDFGKLPVLKMPQRFYRGETRQILDLTLKPEVKFLRAKWELTRWGRGAPHPVFVLGFNLSEIPAFTQNPALPQTA